MRKLFLFLVVTVMLVLLCACKTDVTVDLYVRDIIDAASGETLVAYGTLKIEHPGEELDQTIVAIVKEGFPEATDFRIEKEGFDSYVVASIEVPVVNNVHAAMNDYPESMFSVVCGLIDRGQINLILVFSSEMFDKLNRAVYSEYFQELSVENMTITVSLHNDLRYGVSFELESVYANREPVPFSDVRSLVPRQNLDIRLSDVLRDFAYQNAWVSIGRMTW